MCVLDVWGTSPQIYQISIKNARGYTTQGFQPPRKTQLLTGMGKPQGWRICFNFCVNFALKKLKKNMLQCKHAWVYFFIMFFYIIVNDISCSIYLEYIHAVYNTGFTLYIHALYTCLIYMPYIPWVYTCLIYMPYICVVYIGYISRWAWGI